MENFKIPSVPGMTPEQLLKIYRIKKTQLKMLKNRGYDIESEIGILKDESNRSYDTSEQAELFGLSYFVETYLDIMEQWNIYHRDNETEMTVSFAESMTNVYRLVEPSPDLDTYIYVRYFDGEVKKEKHRSLIKEIAPMEKQIGVYPLVDPFDQPGEEDLMPRPELIRHTIIVTEFPFELEESLKNLRFHIEIFRWQELQFDVTEHYLVPKHRLVTGNEKDAKLDQLHISPSELPTLLTSDPISRYFGAQNGDLFIITRRPIYTTPVTFAPYYRIVKEHHALKSVEAKGVPKRPPKKGLRLWGPGRRII